MKQKHEIILEWGSVASACAAIISAVFVGWQAILFRQALDNPFQANLQNRQIETCEDLMVAHHAWRSSGMWLGFPTSTRWTTSDPALVTYSSPLTDAEMELATEERNVERQSLRAELRSSIVRLGVLSGPTEESISKALNALSIDSAEETLARARWRALRDASPMTEAQHDEIRSEHDPGALLWDRRAALGVESYEEEAEPLIERCRQLMVGAEPGLF